MTYLLDHIIVIDVTLTPEEAAQAAIDINICLEQWDRGCIALHSAQHP